MADKPEMSSPNKSISLFRLVVDQKRVTPDVETYQYAGTGTEEDPYVVTWIPEDPGNPMNWSASRKWTITCIVAIETFAMAFASSAYSGAVRELAMDLTHNSKLITAGISLFVLGFALGPLLWAPLSEVFGRQMLFLISFAGFTAFNIGCVGAQNIGQLLVLRFFAGAFGSSPLTNAGGVIADIFNASERGMAMALFALAPSMGPCIGPLAGFLSETHGWRWVMALIAIFSGFMLILGALLVPETYALVLLKKRSNELSKRTGKVYKTKTEIDHGTVSVKDIMKTSLVRPWILLFLEPIVLVLSVYIAIVYGTLYLLFAAYPIVFQQGRHWSEGVGGLPFMGVAVGMILAIVFIILLQPLYNKAAAKSPGGIAPPEERLVAAMAGAIAVPVGMFWFAWTNDSSIHWISPVAAGGAFGFGLVLIFLAITSYLIDAYTIFAASVLAANSLLRSLFGAAFPMFTEDMYSSLGIHWASSVPAFLAVACLPFPFVLYKYGPAIRQRCVYAAEAERAMAELRQKDTEVDSTNMVVEKNGLVTERRQSGSEASTTEAVEKGSFEPITASRTATDGMTLTRTKTSGSVAEAANYHANPYDIDRVNTHASVHGLNMNPLIKTKSRA